MNRLVFCGNCGKENRGINITTRMMTENNRILLDDLQFKCWNCGFKVTVRLEEDRSK